MEFDRMLAWILVGAIALIFVGISAYGLSKRGRERSVTDFVQRVRLDAGDERMKATLAARTTLMTQASAVGMLVALCATVLALLMVPAWQAPSAVIFVLLPLLLLGVVGGGVVAALKNSLFSQTPDAPRIARASSPGLDDYVDGVRRAAPNILMGLATAVTIAVVVLATSGAIRASSLLVSPALPVFAVTLAAWIAARTLTRRVLAHPQPATNIAELAWDDAMRADTLIKLSTLVTLLCWASAVASAYPILLSIVSHPESNLADAITTQLFTWGIIFVTFTEVLGKARRHFLLRLWPDTDFATGTVREARV